MPFTLSKPLRFGDCDLTGIAYHPAYLSMLVDVKEALFASISAPWLVMMHDRRMGMPVLTMNLEFKRPSTYGDVLDFAMRVATVGRSSLDLETTVSVRGDVIWIARERIVATSLDNHRSTPWPDDVRSGLTRYMDDAA